MPYEYANDDDLERSTNRWMVVGVVLLAALAAVFPLYRWYEPESRASSRDEQLASLAAEGESLWQLSCSSCHGLAGEGGIGPALNSKQFLESVTDDQTTTLVAVGIPGSQMNAYSLDFGGPMTSEQIKAVVAYVRTWEPDAPDVPNWRDPLADSDVTDTTDPDTTDPDTTEPELRGSELFAQTCASCHGADLEGTALAPALGPGSDASEESDARLMKPIREGDDEMPAFGDQLSEDQIESLVAYLREVQQG